jgi:transposase-like protein
MKKSKFTEEQIAYTLQLAEAGPPVADVCRQMGISEATFYVWKKKYAQLGVGRAQAAASAHRGEHPAQAAGGRSDAGQADPAGSHQKKI